MTKRAWWLVGLNVLIPGSAQVLAGNRRLGRFGLGSTLVLWVLLVLTGVLYLIARGFLIALLTNTVVLWLLVLGALFYAVLWIILTLDTLRLVRLVRVAPAARAFVGGLSIAALVLVSGTAGYAAVTASAGIGLLDTVFSGGQIAPPVDGRYNILLLGGDAGPDRPGPAPRQHLGRERRRRDRTRSCSSASRATWSRRPSSRARRSTGRSRTATTAATTA